MEQQNGLEIKTGHEDSILLCTFLLGQAAFGIEAQLVQEIVKLGDVTPVHDAPTHVIGIRNLRGRIVTVIDLGVLLELGPVKPGSETRLLIMEWLGEPSGFLVDSVSEAISVTQDQITPPPANLHSIQRSKLRGVYQDGERLVAVLNSNALFQSDDDVKTVAEAHAAV